MAGFLNCGKLFLMSDILSRKQGDIHKITKSINQYPQKYENISDEIQPLNEYKNSTVVSDVILLSIQGSNIDLFFTRGRLSKIDIYYMSQIYFHIPKNYSQYF